MIRLRPSSVSHSKVRKIVSSSGRVEQSKTSSNCIVCGLLMFFKSPCYITMTCSRQCKTAYQTTPAYQANLQIGRDKFNQDPVRRAEVNAKISSSLMGHDVSQAERERRSKMMRGPVGRKIIDAAAKSNAGRPMLPHVRAILLAVTSKPKSEETKKKLSLAKTGMKYKPWSEEAKQNVMRIRAEKGTPVFARNSKIEFAIAPKLATIGYRHTAEKAFFVNHPDGSRKVPDFIDYKNRRVVEVWGTYWHRDQVLPEGKKHATIGEYVEWYATALQGPWQCQVVWDDEIEAFLTSEGLGDLSE